MPLPDTFVPLTSLANSAPGQGFTALEFKPPQPAAAPKTSAPNPASNTSKSPTPTRALQTSSECDQPKVTLQREGEKVTSIRIECNCGQVIDLSCAY
jgi:hypothetical protein